MLVQDLLDESAARFADRPALFTREGASTYGELSMLSDGVGSRLRELGIERGDRVALVLENSPEFAVSYFGILKAGAIAVPLHTGIDAVNLRAYLAHAGAKAVIASAGLLGALEEIRNATGGPSIIIISGCRDGRNHGQEGFLRLEQILADPPVRKDGVRSIDIDLESIVYTSGSTGEPKGVMLSHLNTVSNMRSIAEYFRLTPEDRIMVVLPFSYIYGKSLLLTHLLSGGSAVINNNFTFPNLVLEEMRNRSVTGFAGVPSTFAILLSRSKLRDMRFPTLRYMCQAGGGMAPAVQKELAAVISPAELYVMYGATEAAPRLTYLEPSMLSKKTGSIGKAVPNVEVFIADERGERLPRGTEGEIVARGSNIMAGYWKDPARTAEVLKGGLYFTGDLGVEDEEGFLFVTGRKRDFVKVKGFRVSTKEVEEAILEMEGVEEAAVAGVPDAVLGESLTAYVVAAPGVTAEAVRAFTASRLPPYKVPGAVVFLESLPKNASGKVIKAALGS